MATDPKNNNPGSKAPPSMPGRTSVSSSLKPISNIKDAKIEAQAMAGGAMAARSSAAPPSARAGKRLIMLVDDDAAARSALRLALGSDFEIVEAKDGMEAVELLGTIGTPSMVVSDITMPRVDGFTLAKIIRGNPLLKKVQFMFVSAKNGPQEVTQALVLGACQFVPKTTPVTEIAAKIRKIII